MRLRRLRDDGFTLIETMVSIGMIVVMTAAMTTFFLRTTAATSLQSQTQAANQLASAAMEQVSLLPGDALVFGRPACAVTTQWASPAPGAGTYLAQMNQVSDVSLASLVCPTVQTAIDALLASESLPTVQTTKTLVNGRQLAFTQNFYVGLCWQKAGATSSACTKPTGTTVPTGYLSMLRVVIAVTWGSARCPAGTCTYLTDTLVNDDVTDLTFELAS